MSYQSMYVDVKQYVAMNVIAADNGFAVEDVLEFAIEEYVERYGSDISRAALDGRYGEMDYESDYGLLRWLR